MILWIILVVVLALVSSPTFTTHYGFVGLLAPTVASLLAFRYSDRLLDLVFGKETVEKLSLSLQLIGRKPEDSNSDAWKDLSRSVGCQWPRSDGQMNQLYLRFGLIRVASIGGDAVGCRASVRVRSSFFDEPYWEDKGFLNWYDQSKRESLRLNIKELNQLGGDDASSSSLHEVGINHYLRNSQGETIYEDQLPKNLQLFYVMREGGVVLCTDLESQLSSYLGNTMDYETWNRIRTHIQQYEKQYGKPDERCRTSLKERPFEQDFEVTFTAQGMKPLLEKYHIKVYSFDDFEIERD